MTQHNTIFVGIDIAKQKFDVAFSNKKTVQTILYTERGIQQFINSLKEIQPALICMEATGGLERLLHQKLCKKGFSVAIVNPRQIRDFARSTGQLAKQNRCD